MWGSGGGGVGFGSRALCGWILALLVFSMTRLRTFRFAGIIALFAVAALPCLASQVAVLKNGFSIRHERHEIVGDVTRLYVSADGSSFVDVPTEQVDHFEAAADLPVAGSIPDHSSAAVRPAK